MNANLSSISPLLSDLKQNEKTYGADLKKEGPSFDSVLGQAERREPMKETVREPARAPESNRRESVDGGDVEDSKSPQTVPKAMPKLKRIRQDEQEEKLSSTDKRNTAIDDKAGVVGKSFDHMVVSYPVSHIAKESLDEKTVTDLKDQGLWDLPSMVMAQPSQPLALMKDALTKLSGEETEDVLPMTKPLAQFMDSLESELGVKPDRLIQAFKKLSPDQLQNSPKETMVQLVKNLGLDSKDEARANELFSKLLSQLDGFRDQSLNPALMAAAIGGATQNAQSPTDKVNDKAVLKGRTQAASSRYAQNVSSSEKSLKAESSMPKDFEVPSQETSGLKSEAAIKEGNVTPSHLKTAKADGAPAQLQAQQQGPLAAPGPLAPLNQSPAQDVLSQQSQSAAPDSFKANSMVAQKGNEAGMKDVKDLGKSLKDSKVSVKSVSTSSTGTTPLAVNDFAPAKADTIAQPVAAGGIAAGELKAGEDSKHEAIRSIVNQAQMLAQKGGGEVRMSLKPDHLGEIQLKVAMEGNRVNVQMTTERGEVKKLIEQSVHELRHGLASHNLSMDKLDVSVGNRDTQNFLKGQPDFGAARDFANQFQQQQQNRRDLLNDLGSIRGGAQKSMMAVDRQAQANRVMSARNSSGRLNVVA